MTSPHQKQPYWNDYTLTVNRPPGKAHCEPNWSWQPAPLQDYDLWYTVSGHGEAYVNDTLYPIFPGAFILLQPGDRVSATHDPAHPLYVLYCHFEPDPLQNSMNRRLPLPQERFVVFRDTSLIESLMHQLIDLALASQPGHEVEIDILLKLILTRWITALNERDTPSVVHRHQQLILQVQDKIRYLMKAEIDFDELSKDTGYTSRHISKMMKEYTGLTLKETITKLKMERAVHLLNESALAVGEIADALGYSDIYTFSKLFKRYYGFSPSKRRNG